ncbi:MAG: ABC transporter substrate-binding protein [Actinomycetota bacterium]|nr:ABC transporter substrate-binding protein [Actinomycetota bacterium]
MANDPIQGWIPGRYNRRQLILGSSAAATMAAALAACGSDAAPVTDAAPAATEAAAPASGGVLRVGTLGGANDLLDGQHIVSKADIARQATGWEPLMSFSPEFVPEYTHGIAKDVTANAADNYTITLKDGVKFSNGNAVTADDVIYSLTRVLDADLAVFGGSALRPILESTGLSKVDEQTVDVQLKQAVSNFKENLCAYTLAIVPTGYTRFDGDPTTQIGTGPYMLTEFEIGKKSVHVKNPFYWDEGLPNFDSVEIIDFADSDALVSALLADQIDVAADVPATAIETINSTEGFKTLNAAGGGWLTMVMAVDQEPFTDVRVRQAMRLIVDRDAMVEQVLSGFGRIANDLFSPLDANYLGDELPQRVQDLDAAKALLAEAGLSDLTIDLFAPNDTAGLPEMVQLFAEQAKGAGITVNAQVLDGGTYWGDEYLKRTFAVDYWGTRNFLPQVASSSLPTAPYPGDHWPPAGSTFIEDYNAALAETDDAKRKVITDKMQTELHEEGGLIIPFFQNTLDGFNARVQGMIERPNTLNMDHYGRGYKNLFFA